MVSAVALALALSTVTGLGVRWVLPRQPEPVGVTDKPRYAELADLPMLLSCCGITAIAGMALAFALPWQQWPIWTVWLTLGVQLVANDARMTWLPLALTRPLWLLTVLAVGLTGFLAGWHVGLQMVVAAACVGGFFWLFWRLRPLSLGFGDVRLAPVIGAVAASVSVEAVFWSLLIGTAAGAALGLGLRLRGSDRPFPYGPPLCLGTLVLLPLVLLTH